MSDLLEQKRNEIAERMRELEPLIDEYRQLEAAATALAGVTPARNKSAAAAAARAPRRPRAARPRAAARSEVDGGPSKRRGRPRGSGTRARQALELVAARPGITIPEMAGEMGIKQNYLYRVLPTLEKEGKVAKRERGWHVIEGAAE